MLGPLLGMPPKNDVVVEPYKRQKLSPFDILNAINEHNPSLITEENEKDYVPYLVNKGLSYGADTIIFANEMNSRPHVPPLLQFHFFINTIRPRKRYNKWLKAEKIELLELIKEYYGYSNDKARQVLPLLSSSQIEIIKSKLNKGGTTT
jgi:hypothetical protein